MIDSRQQILHGMKKSFLSNLFPPKKPTHRIKAQAELIEARILFSAVPLGGGLNSGDIFEEIGLVNELSTNGHNFNSTSQKNLELVVIDERVDGLAQILQDLTAQQSAGRALTIIQVGANSDAIAQISEQLRTGERFSAIHVVSHSVAANLQLGRDGLNAQTVVDQAQAIAGWSNFLTEDADIRLYGCSFASTPAGIELLNVLTSLTNADVAASNNTTGHHLRGADWQLEVTTGVQSTAPLLTEKTQISWQHSLDGSANLGTPISIPTIPIVGPFPTNPTPIVSSNGVAMARNSLGNSLVVWGQADSLQPWLTTGYAQLVGADGSFIGPALK